MYDTIVIGRDLSSLIAAVAASRREMRTLLILEGNPDAEHKEAGYSFPVDSTPFSGLGHEQTVLRLFRELHIPIDEAPQMVLLDPAFQVILPEHRVDLFHDYNQLIGDMIREFPHQKDEIARFYNAVSKVAPLIERWIDQDNTRHPDFIGMLLRNLRRFGTAVALPSALTLRKNGMTRSPFKSVIEAQIALLSHLDVGSWPFPLTAAYLLALPARGLFYPVGGRSEWMNWLHKAFTNSGGVLMPGSSVMRVDAKRSIVIDLESGESPQTVQGKKLIVSANWEKLNLLVFNQKSCRRLVRRLASNSHNDYPFCLHLGIHEGGLPERMARYALVVSDESKPACGENLLFVERSLVGETNRAPEGRLALGATMFLKDSPLVLDDAKLHEIAKAIIDSLERFLPFLRESIDYVNIEKSIAVARQSQEIVNHKYGFKTKPIVGINTLSPASPLPNVFLTGAIFQAGLGFEGEIVSGIKAAFRAGQEVQ